MSIRNRVLVTREYPRNLGGFSKSSAAKSRGCIVDKYFSTIISRDARLLDLRAKAFLRQSFVARDARIACGDVLPMIPTVL